MLPAQKALRKWASSKKIPIYQSFFKTGPGEYGEGDLFLGVTVPRTRQVAKSFHDLPFPEIKILLESAYHEDRLLGLVILVNQYEKTKDLEFKKKCLDFYLRNRERINNWDLVDVSVSKIVGDYCYRIQSPNLIWKLAKSRRHWDRRMAIVSTFSFIRNQHTQLTFELAEMFLSQTEDLMHKATGWMLREAGKKDRKSLVRFISRFGPRMPRTMLRYAIEHFDRKDQLKILLSTKKPPQKR